jgi:hypothetical protein
MFLAASSLDTGSVVFSDGSVSPVKLDSSIDSSTDYRYIKKIDLNVTLNME